MPRRDGDGRKAAQRKPRRRKNPAQSRGLAPAETGGETTQAAQELAEAIRQDGGSPLALYREPFGGHSVVLASLPIDRVEPTPYQRDVSEAHVKRIATAMERVGRYLDPIVAVRQDGRYWTPNGSHRLSAMRALGSRAIMALVLPEHEVAFQILALNCEKAHNLKERSLEVIRMYRGMVGLRAGPESELAPLFEEAALATFGAAYEKRPRYAASAYGPVVRRVDSFLDLPIEQALRVREARADRLLALDDGVNEVVASLKKRGLDSPYIKSYVVARINPLRFSRSAHFDFDEAVETMLSSAARFDAAAVRREDLARMGGAPAEAEA